MISYSHRFLFIHVPKTGGNSLQSLLLPYAEEELSRKGPLLEGDGRFELRNRKLGLTKHATLNDYMEALGRHTLKGFYKFAIMRNPWERMISYYFSPHRGRDEWDREDFLNLLAWVPPLRRFVLPQSHWVSLRAQVENLLGRPGEGLNRMVTLIRFEELQQDVDAVCNELGLTLPPLPHRNASKRKHYSDYYDEELVEAVRRRHIEEITFGGYRFEPGGSPCQRESVLP